MPQPNQQAAGARIKETRTHLGEVTVVAETTRALPTSYMSQLFKNCPVTVNADPQLAGWRVGFYVRKDVNTPWLDCTGLNYLEVRRNIIQPDSTVVIELLVVDVRP